uniref:Uncharacterized protein n=1 Tax=Physcomitrium patens TaxID=3218 RepID=A0A2K1K5V9_PHYPA|nr:hypothetical protein PHYPA_011061 [Physcomitrium patens]
MGFNSRPSPDSAECDSALEWQIRPNCAPSGVRIAQLRVPPVNSLPRRRMLQPSLPSWLSPTAAAQHLGDRPRPSQFPLRR